MEKPRLIEFDSKCLAVLQTSLIAVQPYEGCALLIGEKKLSRQFQENTIWHIRFIWPCCNVWEPDGIELLETSIAKEEVKKTYRSRRTRFFIDPREQLLAQKWARKQKWEILGSAHSHPEGQAVPSKLDHSWINSPSLMVIVDGTGNIRSWWIDNSQNLRALEIAYSIDI